LLSFFPSALFAFLFTSPGCLSLTRLCAGVCVPVFVCGGITRALLHAKLKLKGKLQLVITQAVERDKQLHALAAQFSSNFALE